MAPPPPDYADLAGQLVGLLVGVGVVAYAVFLGVRKLVRTLRKRWRGPGHP